MLTLAGCEEEEIAQGVSIIENLYNKYMSQFSKLLSSHVQQERIRSQQVLDLCRSNNEAYIPNIHRRPNSVVNRLETNMVDNSVSNPNCSTDLSGATVNRVSSLDAKIPNMKPTYPSKIRSNRHHHQVKSSRPKGQPTTSQLNDDVNDTPEIGNDNTKYLNRFSTTD